MKDLITINQEIEREIKRLRELEKNALPFGEKMVDAEADYEKALAREIITLPSMAANKAERLARGEVADSKRDWKLAEVVYKANARAQENSRQILSVLQSRLKYME
jgi:N-acetylmuramic acid 6-phosphate (MurNAc-6-P) etherase